jgi:dUTPase
MNNQNENEMEIIESNEIITGSNDSMVSRVDVNIIFPQVKLSYFGRHPNALSKGTRYSAGIDLITEEDVVINPRHICFISTSTFITDSLWLDERSGSQFPRFPDDEYAFPEMPAIFLYARSSMSKRGLILANGVGVIDIDYRDEIKVPLLNVSQSDSVRLNAGERVAQLIAHFVSGNNAFPLAVKRTGGFGSTGK